MSDNPNPDPEDDSHDGNGTDPDDQRYDIDRDPGRSSEQSRYSFLIDEHLKDAGLRNSEHGEMAERCRDVFRRVGYGEDVQNEEALRRELNTVREKKDDVDAKIRDLQSERERLARKETRLEERVSKSDSRKEKYDGMLESMESLLAQGGHVDPTHPIVKNAANLMKITPENVIDDLRDRHPAIPDHAFVPFDETDEEWHGFDN